MDLARLRRLLAPFADLDDLRLAQLSAYLDLLLRWNARISLTAVREEENIVIRHFGESLFAAARLLSPDDHLSLADLGSGAGFPGLPMKIFAPGIRLTLIESLQKKATFLREAARTLAFPDAQVLTTRAEQLTATYDLVTLRAVERFKDVLPIAARLVQPTGRLALLIGASQQPDAERLLPSFSWQPPIPIPESSSRIIMVGTSPARHESDQ